jgi:hypothetical protein
MGRAQKGIISRAQKGATVLNWRNSMKDKTEKVQKFSRGMVHAYVISRYHRQSSIYERMNACEGGGDVFEPLNPIRKELKAYALALRDENPKLEQRQVERRINTDLGKLLRND